MAAKEARTRSLATLDQSPLSVTGDTLSESREPAIFELIHLKNKFYYRAILQALFYNKVEIWKSVCNCEIEIGNLVHITKKANASFNEFWTLVTKAVSGVCVGINT